MNGHRIHTRLVLSDWRTWVFVMFFGLSAVVAALYFVNGRTSRAVARTEAEIAARHTQIVASADSAKARCLASIPQLERISTHLRGVNQLANTLVKNSRAAVDATTASDPLRASRVANLNRLVLARTKIRAVESLPIPTRQQCERQRQQILRGDHK